MSLAGVLGFLVARRQPGNPIGWLMLAGAVGLALVNAAESYAMLAYRRGYHLSFGPAVLLLGYSWILPLAALATAILLFPDGHLPSPRWRWVRRMLGAAVACLLGSTYAVVLSTAFGHRVRLDASGGLAAVDDPSGRSAWLAAMEHLILPVIAACLLSFVIAQVLNWRRSSGERRQQLKWLLAGTVGFLFGGIVSLPVSALDPTPPVPAEVALTVLNALGFVALPACIAVAILKYRLYDIDRIISRTLAYAIVTGLLVGVYAGLGVLATRVLTFHTPVAVAASTLAAAALFNPVRGRVQHAVDRWFNRARYDAGRDHRRVRGTAARRRRPGLGPRRPGRGRTASPGTGPHIGMAQQRGSRGTSRCAGNSPAVAGVPVRHTPAANSPADARHGRSG